MVRAQIIGTGSYAPEKVVTNDDLAKLVETSDAWIVERTGIRERRQAAPGEVTSDMAVKAAIRALEMARTRAEELDLIVVGTISPDMPMPSCAAFVQAKLGAKKAFAFDVSSRSCVVAMTDAGMRMPYHTSSSRRHTIPRASRGNILEGCIESRP